VAPSRIGEHSVAGQLRGAQGQHAGGGLGHILDHHVQVDLLRHGHLRPGRRAVVRRALEGEPGRAVVVGHHDEVVVGVGDRLAQQAAVERGQGVRIRAVQDDVVQAADR
jgi:hypothetical protein